ncbi:MAG: hypothetical protein WDN69_10120 [Aliidongia sp.]
MRKAAIVFVVLAITLGVIRLCTGLVNAYDENTTYFVIKTTPSVKILRQETPDNPVTEDILVYADEFQVPFGDEYMALMRVVRELITFLLSCAAVSFYAGKFTKRRR